MKMENRHKEEEQKEDGVEKIPLCGAVPSSPGERLLMQQRHSEEIRVMTKRFVDELDGKECGDVNPN